MAQKVRKFRIPTASLRPIAPKNRPRAPRSRPCAGLSRRPVGRRWQRNRTDFTARAQCRLLGTTLPYTWRFGPTAVTGLDSGVCVEFRILLTGKPREIVLIKSGVLCWFFWAPFTEPNTLSPALPHSGGGSCFAFFGPLGQANNHAQPKVMLRVHLSCFGTPLLKPRDEGERRASTKWRGTDPRVRPRHRDVPWANLLSQAPSEGTPHLYFRCGAQSPGCPFFRFLALGTQRKEPVVRGRNPVNE